MKKIGMCVLAVILCFSGCYFFRDDVIASLGPYTKREFFSSGGFQDFTDYAKYTFEMPILSNNPYFEEMTEDDRQQLKLYLNNFEEWIEAIRSVEPQNEVVVNYDFDRTIISEGDYLYIYDDPDYPPFGCYNIYFLDAETNVLYYFHNNI